MRTAGAQYSVVEWTRAGVAIRSVVAPVPQPELASHRKIVTRDNSRYRRYVSDLSNVRPTPMHLCSEQKAGVSLLWLTFCYV